MTLSDLLRIVPELILFVTLLGLIFVEVTYHGERIRLVPWITLLGLSSALINVFLVNLGQPMLIFDQKLVVDGFALFFKFFFISLGILVVAVSHFSKEIIPAQRSEYFSFVTAGVLAMCLLASAADFLLVFLVLQLMGVCFCFMAGYIKNKEESAEACAKFMILNAVASVIFLYALALLFSHFQSLNLYEMKKVFAENPMQVESGLVVSALLFLAFGFYFGVFPMHFWVPDVLQGAPVPSTVFFSIGGPAAAFAVTLRFFIVAFSDASGKLNGVLLEKFNWSQITAIASGVTMILGALLALRQTSAKRLIVCLILSQTGVLLMGLLVINEVGIPALLLNMLVQLLSIVGLFCAFSFIYDALESDKLSTFGSAMKGAIPEYVCLLLFLVCLLGLPPFPGFIGRFALITAVVQSGGFLLAGVAVVSIVLCGAAFARLAFSLTGHFRQSRVISVVPTRGQRLMLMSLLIPLLLIVLFTDGVIGWARHSLINIIR